MVQLVFRTMYKYWTFLHNYIVLTFDLGLNPSIRPIDTYKLVEFLLYLDCFKTETIITNRKRHGLRCEVHQTQ